MPWIFSLHWRYIFYHSEFLSNLRLPWKTVVLKFFTVLSTFLYIQNFWATCACPEKQSLPWNFSLYWIFFIIQFFWATCAWLKEQNRPEIFTVLNIYFLSFRIFEQLALALKNSCPEIFHFIEIFFIIHDFWATWDCSETQSLPWNFSLHWNIFYHSGFLSNLRLPWKTVVLKFFTVLKDFLSFMIFEQLEIALKTEFALNIFTVLNTYLLSFMIFEQLVLAMQTEFDLNSLYLIYIFLSFRIFEQLEITLKNRVRPEYFHCIEIFFYHSGFLSNLRLPWKQSLTWIHCI